MQLRKCRLYLGKLAKAEEHLAKRMNDIREAQLHGLRPTRTFRFAATKYLQDYAQKKSIKDDAVQLRMLDPLIDGSSFGQCTWAHCRSSSPSDVRKASRPRP